MEMVKIRFPDRENAFRAFSALLRRARIDTYRDSIFVVPAPALELLESMAILFVELGRGDIAYADKAMQDVTSSEESVLRAREFAIQAHGVQRYGDHPYSVHLDAVAAIVTPFGKEAQILGYLHDVVEDTAVSREEVRSTFGDFIAECVSVLTDEPGANRKERKAKTNAKLSEVPERLHLALIVKSADRLANVRMSASKANSKLDMYRREHSAFRHAAYRPHLCESIWSELAKILAAESSL